MTLPQAGGRGPGRGRPPVDTRETAHALVLLRRLGFYAFALWGAITLNFLLPRLMPGEPIDGLLARLSPGAARGQPESSRPPRLARGSRRSRCSRAYFTYLGQLVHGDFGISTSNFPSPGERGDRPHAPVLDLPRRRGVLVRVRDRHVPRDARRVAPRRGRRQRLHAAADGARRVPRVLHRARRRLLPRAEVGLVPDPARLRHRRRARLQLDLPVRASFRHAQLRSS